MPPCSAVRHLVDRVGAQHKAGMTSPPVPAAVFQIIITGQVVPRRNQGIERLQIAARQLGHALRAQYRQALLLQHLMHVRRRGVRRQQNRRRHQARPGQALQAPRREKVRFMPRP
jgi:hypothetical protein